MSHSPLAHITILDLTRVRAGPTCVKQLSDWGATVIKVEGPAEDDMTGARDGSDFQNLHRNKQSIVLDLKHPDGVAVLKRLAASADVVVENFRPDVKHRLGIGYDDLRAVNPRLVYASISGFGEDGPYAARPGFDMVAQGMGGMMSVTGLPGHGPLRAGIPLADLTSGLYAAIGILIALLDRDRTGQGQWVKASLLQAQVAMLDFQAAAWLMEGKVYRQTGNDHPYTTPMGVYPAADQDIVIGASGQGQYRKLCEAIEAPHLLEDARFATADARLANRPAFTTALSAVTRTRKAAAWVAVLNAAGIACGPINDIQQVFADPQVQAHGLAATVGHPRLGPIAVVGAPITLSASEARITLPAPDKGEHTDGLLRAAGYAEAEIAAMRQAGAVG
ncbi:CaiB/BaiF CoA transferase family protein [Falsiroseomonas stagni]|uniref:Crotonobetainyl-CoA:carnitine CoA-transferase CaiB n=1 Tax=Falsiroseomonas stagni DSM 19981 TaxID=1123062 RepID=A0A1I4AVW7_9PROT|nr:CaiB/BaiF CoA-transferase family protein [Falsiroseomonas stagni]SFK60732.1 Crotonobetainyl-CoA:carnitine CoA-transferase CaiB [Falsiroseomonas stagni DSM 19981]